MFPQNRYFSLGSDKSGTLFVRCGNEVIVVPLTETMQITFITEPSAAFETDMLLLPCGSLKPGEDSADTANRELQEEIGKKAERLDYMGEILPWSKYLSVRSFVYLARDLVASKLEGDEDYDIGQLSIPIEDVESLIARGALRDARIIAAISLARSYLSHEFHSATE